MVTVSESVKLRNDDGVCWKCRAKLGSTSKFFCASCGTVVPVTADEDYFTLFDMKPNFRLSTTELQTKFKGLQVFRRKVTLHPDKFTLKSATEAQISESVSSLLNKAYSTLIKPLTRGLYMLEMQGMTLGEDVNADDPEFLLEIMELNEEIADTSSLEELRRKCTSVKAEVETLSEVIADAFQAGRLEEAKDRLIRFKYFDNILEKLKERIPPL